MIALMAHGGMLCPDEVLAGLSAAGAVGGMSWMLVNKWHSLRRKVGFWLLARHIVGRCNHTCTYCRYSALAPA